MVQYAIEITELAENDLENIGDYIAFTLKNSNIAVDMVKGIRKRINSLQYFPKRNNLDDDRILAEYGVRAEQYKRYKIFYIISEQEKRVYIIRILHTLVESRVWLYRTLGRE